ncbi:valine N-monooxygenase 1-like protein [Tanacetum coccineum]
MPDQRCSHQRGGTDGGPGDEEIEHVDSCFMILSYTYAFYVMDYIPWLQWRTDFDGREKIFRNVDMMLESLVNTSNNNEWAMAEMINELRIFDKAVQELDYVVGKDRLVQESDLTHLNYIKSCVREAFRLHPIAPFNLPHVSSVNTTVAGYFIPKGSHVLLSRSGLRRNPEVWEDLLTFNPDCHMNGDNEVVLTDHNLYTFSFSTGRRGCPRVLLGTTMTVMLMATLVQGFKWELPPNESHIDLDENLYNLGKAKPLMALAKPCLPLRLYLRQVVCVFFGISQLQGTVMFVGPFKVIKRVGDVAYKLELPEELSRVHNTFHVSNLKKCHADEPLAVPLDGLHFDDKLQFVEEPIEITDREVKRLKRSRIPLVKVRWNSKRGPEFTWEREDQFRKKYPHLFSRTGPSSSAAS